MTDAAAGRASDDSQAERPPAAFIGVGAMVGAGIFALLGSAGEVAGAAVWISFLIAGAVAGLQGYSFAKFGARYPSPAGCSSTSSGASATGMPPAIIAWLILAANAIVTGMVAVSFGSYASSAVADGSEPWVKVFAVAVVVVMTTLNVARVAGRRPRPRPWSSSSSPGSSPSSPSSTLANLDADLLAFSGYPGSPTSCRASR